MKTLLFWMVVGIYILVAAPRSNEIYLFNIIKEQPAILTLDWKKHEAFVTFKDKNTMLENISEDFVMAWNEYGETDITFDDFNFDGYTDIAITFSVWQIGNNSCYDYYFYEPKDKKFYKAIAHVCNLEVAKKEHVLHAHMKDGLEYYHKYYQINEKGKPYLFLRGKNHVIEDDISPVVYFSSEVMVNVERVYFYDMWDGKRLKSYLVKGDKVKVLDEVSTREGVWWVKVSYQGKKKIYEYWLKLSDLVFEPMQNINLLQTK